MISSEEYQWYRLFCAKGMGPKTIHGIINELRSRSLSVSTILAQDPRGLSFAFKLNTRALQGLHELNEDRCHQEFGNLKENGIQLVHLEHLRYPERVKARLGDSAPPILFCAGSLGLLSVRSVSVVGSRNISDFALSVVRTLTKELSDLGYNIVSGYAKGTDTAAHLAALEVEGTTTLVLAYGILDFHLKKQFSGSHGKNNMLVISQFHPNDKWRASNAMIRNKVVVSLSNAVVIVQSGPERDSKGMASGTFDAGKTALKYKVPLFVLTSSGLPPEAEGNRELIKLGGMEFRPDNAIQVIRSVLADTAPAIAPKSSQGHLF